MTEAVDTERESAQRTAILNAAMHLFGKQGYTGTSMRDIANAVGVLPGSLYAHIQGKEALLISIVADGINRFLAAVEPIADSSAPAATRLRKMIIAHIEVVADNPQRSQVVFHQWRFLGEQSQPQAVERRQAYEDAFSRVVKDGVKNAELKADLNQRIAVLTLLGGLNWSAEWLSPDGRLSPAQLGDLMADSLLGGILA